MISVKKNLVVKQIQPHMIVKTSCSNFPAKSLVLQRQHLQVVCGSVAIVIAFSKKKYGKIAKPIAFQQNLPRKFQ